MKIESFNEPLDFDNNRIVTKVILETSFSKEIQILLEEGQIMKEHKAPFPIIIHLLEGMIKLGVEEKSLIMKKGDIITLDSNIHHDLLAKEDSIVRLTLSKLDKASRVEKAANKA
jgi:quercetin dioxygenase-like cupin family protein